MFWLSNIILAAATAAIIRFVLWDRDAVLLWESLFWIVMAWWWASNLRISKVKLPWVLIGLGSLANAAVVLTNGGAMPVVGAQVSNPSLSVDASLGHRLLWLADQSVLFGASLGDLVMGTGLFVAVVMVIGKSASRANRHFEQQIRRPLPRNLHWRQPYWRRLFGQRQHRSDVLRDRWGRAQ